MVKKRHPRTSCKCMACSSKKTKDVSEVASTFAQSLPVVFNFGREPLPLCIGNTCGLDIREVHATVLHGHGDGRRGVRCIRASVPS